MNLPGPPQQTVAAVSLSAFLRNPEERRQRYATVFDAIDARAQALREAREQSNAKLEEDLFRQDFNAHPKTMRIIKIFHGCKSEQERNYVWTQVQVIGNDLGWDQDVAYTPEEEDEGNVYDHTTTGRRQGGGKFGPVGVKPSRKAGSNVKKSTVNHNLANDWYEKAIRGETIKLKVGRPSNVELATIAYVERRLADQNVRLVRDANGYHPVPIRTVNEDRRLAEGQARLLGQNEQPTEPETTE